MGELSGRVALVTGAGRGQGRAHAVALADAGADVVAVDICRDVASIHYPMSTENDLAETVQLVEKSGRRAIGITADVRDSAAMEAAAARAIAELGGLDIAIANAGICGFNPMTELRRDQWDDMLAINLTGVFNTFRAVVPHMVERGAGRLVATSSGAGKSGLPNLAHYSATKWGVIGFVKSVALELAQTGITANVVCPATVDTPMVHNAPLYSIFAPDVAEPDRETVRPMYAAMNPMRVPWIDPEDVTHAVMFLVSDKARYISGETIEISAAGSAQR
jgi:SDR family mycofactocin-dependent oxidoreductase